MRVVFRVDSSHEIGTGHVMRCVTLAEVLRKNNVYCNFICRSHPGNLIDYIKQRGFHVVALPHNNNWIGGGSSNFTHADWLAEDWDVDAKQTKDAIGDDPVADWLIVDHYSLDARWEAVMASHYHRLMVIDDLADRPHACDLLLDQTFDRDEKDYSSLVSADCHRLCGSQYALLRPEFSLLRPYSLLRRNQPALRELLITLGGIDKDNITCLVLQELRKSNLPADCRITVVMGRTAMWLENVRTHADNMPYETRVLVGVSDMAQLMADSDLAIGAAGTTSWERCCMGLPTIMFVLAENQHQIAEGLNKVGAVRLVDISKLDNQPFIDPQWVESQSLKAMSDAAVSITDGLGTMHVTQTLINKVKNANQLIL